MLLLQVNTKTELIKHLNAVFSSKYSITSDVTLNNIALYNTVIYYWH